MANLRWRRGGAAGGGGTVAGGFPSLSLLCFLFSSLPILFLLLFFVFSFYFSPLSTLCRAILLLLPPFFFFLPFPCFYRQKQGGPNGGAATVGRPSTIRSTDKNEASGRRMVGVLLRQIRERS